MGLIISALHVNIQERFNEGGVEIMSPHYLSCATGTALPLRPTTCRRHAAGRIPDRQPRLD
jgi:hypothetical protein